jgi:hypothetical protein
MRKTHIPVLLIMALTVLFHVEGWGLNWQILRWGIGIILIAFSLLCIVANWTLVYRFRAYRERASLIPLVGGLSGCMGLLILPSHLAYVCWLPLALDIGTWTAVWALWNWKTIFKS